MPGAPTCQGIEIAGRKNRFDQLTKTDELIADDKLEYEVAPKSAMPFEFHFGLENLRVLPRWCAKRPDSVYRALAYGATLLRMIDHSCVVKGSSGYTRS